MYLDKESVQVVMYNPPEYRIKFNIILTGHQGEPDEYVTANNERYYKYMLDKDSGTALMYASSDSDYTDVMFLDYKNHSTQNYSYVVSGEAAFFKCYHMRFYGSYPDSMFADEFYNDFW